jgi:hypothetical protein
MLYVGSDDGVYRLPGALDSTEADVASEQVLESGAVMRLRRLDRVGPGGLFAATATGLYHTVDGDDWVDLGAPREAVYAVGASADGETLYAGTRPAHVYATTAPDASGDADGDGSDARGGDPGDPGDDGHDGDPGDDGHDGDPGDDGDGDAADGDSHADTAAVLDAAALDWRECEGFQALPSRSDWRLPRHEDLAHVRDVKGLPGRPAEVVAAVEVGGVHASADRGDAWVERRGPITDVRPEAGSGDDVDWSRRPGDVHDDVHELAVIEADEWLAATGFGLFRTTDAGGSWTRLDADDDRRYFRTVAHHDGTAYAAAASSSSGNWNDPDCDFGFFAYDPANGLRELDVPTPDAAVTGVVAVDDDVFAGTHRGSLLRGTAEGAWTEVGSFPTDDAGGTYTPLAALDDRERADESPDSEDGFVFEDRS